MERKLASIRKVKEIHPIQGADLIEVVVIDGWKVVASKGHHQVGDHVVYFEIDSFLPIREEFEFLRKSCYRKMMDVEGFRIKTIKLRGQISQGLVMSLDDLPEMKKSFAESIGYFWDIGEDVTDFLGVIKYEPPIPPELNGLVKGFFPSFIPKTDEERIQNLSEIYSELRTKRYYITEKLDGTSVTYYFNNGEFGVCGRNFELIESGNNSIWKFARDLDLENKMREFGVNISIQGELIGYGVNGNRYKLNNQVVRFFSLFDIDNYQYHNLSMLETVANKFGIQTVPILDKNFELPETVDDLLKIADGKSVINEGADREGLVIRSLGQKISFKVISNKYLLKNE